MQARTSLPHRRGFTLTELLTVVGDEADDSIVPYPELVQSLHQTVDLVVDVRDGPVVARSRGLEWARR